MMTRCLLCLTPNDYRLSYYNTEQFAAAGITEEPQTWDDVLEACRALKESGTVEHPFAIALNAEEKTSTCLMWLAYTMNVLFGMKMVRSMRSL